MKTEIRGEPIVQVLLSSGEACRYLGISHSTLKRLVIVGELPALPFTKDRRFRRTDLDALASKSIEEMFKVRRKLRKLSQEQKRKTERNKK